MRRALVHWAWYHEKEKAARADFQAERVLETVVQFLFEALKGQVNALRG